jgi:hypothetical protein
MIKRPFVGLGENEHQFYKKVSLNHGENEHQSYKRSLLIMVKTNISPTKGLS